MVKKEEMIGLKASDSFWRDVFQNYLTNKTHLDTKINWLLGVSGLIMSLSIQYLFKPEIYDYRLGIFIIMIASFLSFILCLLNLDLPGFMSKSIPHSENNVMFHSNFKNKSVDEVVNELKNIKTSDDIIRQYGVNIYNLINRNITLKNKYFKMARNILLIGIIFGIIILVVMFV